MEELGIIIDQDGNYMSFGKWRPREMRDIDYSDDWHDDSFKKTVYYTDWFQNLGIPYILNDNISFHNQLITFAENGIVVIANTKENSTDLGERRITMAVPDSMTEEQINYLLSKKEEFINYESNHYSFIDVLSIGQDFNIVESFCRITDFYNYIDKLITNRQNKKLIFKPH